MRVLTNGELKVQFIQNCVQGINRNKQVAEEIERYFIREEYSKGYRILKQSDIDSFIYYVFKGTLSVLYSPFYHSSVHDPPIVSKLSKTQEARQLLIHMGSILPGNSFGEASLNDQASSYTIVSNTDSVVYKIKKDELLKQLGGNQSTPAYVLRSKLIQDLNYLNTKLRFIAGLTEEAFEQNVQVSYVKELIDPLALKQTPQETPYLKK